MGRRAGGGEDTARAIRTSAVALIAEHGFEGMNLRQLAENVGIRAGSLYNHIESKQRLLFSLLRDVMADLLGEAELALADQRTPVDQLRAFVRCHIEFHVDRRLEVFIGNMELRSLTAPQYAKVVALRRKYERLLQGILEAGVAKGLFTLPDVRVSTFAAIAMLTGITQWYRPDGRLSREELVEIYTKLVCQLVGVNAAK